MNIKFKATLIILSLMVFTALMLSMHTDQAEPKTIQSVQDTSLLEMNEKKSVEISKPIASAKYIQRPIVKTIPKIVQLESGLDADLPLPELMQRTGFKIEFESNIDYANIEPNLL